MCKYAILCVVGCLSCCGCSETMSERPGVVGSQVQELQVSKMKRDNLPKEFEYFSKHKRMLSVNFAHNSTTGQAPVAYQVKRLVKMDTGKLVVPMFVIKRARKGGLFGGRVYQADAWVEVVVAVGNPNPIFHLPIDKRIKKHLLLLRPIIRPGVVSDAAWRVFEFNAAELDGSDELKIPEFETLPVLKDRADGAAIQKQIDAAEKASTTIDGWAT